MGRNKKQGMEYFSVDVVFDENLESLIDIHGADALMFIIRFWQMAYRTENGEVLFSGIVRRTITNRKFMCTEDKIEKIIADAIELGLIDGEAYQRGVLTSSGVKKQIGVIDQLRGKARENRKKNYYSSNNKDCSLLFDEQNETERQRKGKERKVNSTVHTDPEVRTKHKGTGPSPSLCGEEPKKEKSTKEKKLPLPVWDSCEFFRMTSHEYELARVWYLKNNLSEQQLKRAIEAVENWLVIGRTSAAIKARESLNHRPYLYQQWVIEKAQAMVSLTSNNKKNGNGCRAPISKAQANLDFLKQQYEETLLEEKERTIIDITEVEQ